MAQRKSRKIALLAGTALGVIGLGTATAQAGGFLLHEQSAYYQGTSFAGAAAGGPAISAMFWNPAVITQQGPGLSSETDASGVFTRTVVNPSIATASTGANLLPFGPSGDIARDAFVPASYYTYGFSNGLTLGLSVNAPFGARTQPSPIWAGMFYSRESEVKTINGAPTLAYRVNDWLSIGAGVQVQYMKVKLNQAFPGSGLAPTLPESLRIDADGWDVGFTAGITLTPTPWTTIGIGYRSRIDQSIEGTITRPAFLIPIPIPPGFIGIPAALVDVKTDVPLPDLGTISIRQKINESFTLMGTVEWTNWSRLGTVPVTLGTPGGVAPIGVPTALPFNWQDGWLFSVGAEYQWRPNLAVRGGVAFERSPITDDVRGTRLPDNDRVWLSVGATYNWSERLALEFGYSHVFVKDAPINISAASGNPLFNPALGTFIGEATTNANILSVALRYRWAPAPAATPLITKG